MSAEEFIVRVEPNVDVERGYMLVPCIKVNSHNIILDEQQADDSVLYIPLETNLIEGNNELLDINSESDFLNDHNYHHNEDISEDTIGVYYTNYEEDNTENKQQCTFCEKTLSTPGALARHMRTHTGEQPYQCQLCDKRFTQQSNLWKHVLIHTGERRYECRFCDKKFSQRANMEKHLRIHTGEKPYKCLVCNRGFSQRANLNKHERTHTGEKPYSCKYCDREFAQLSNKRKHELLHEGIKRFTCPICCVAFSQQSNLKKHFLTHNKSEQTYICKFCKKTYSKERSFLRHEGDCDVFNSLMNAIGKGIKININGDEKNKYIKLESDSNSGEDNE